MKWLLVGITRKEIREKGYTIPTDDYITLDRGDFGPFRTGDIDFRYDAFDLSVWGRILTIFGPNSFDVIFTDGGLFNIKSNPDIISIKRRLLKTTGCAINYTCPVGRIINCPLGRPLLFRMIPRKEYTYRIMEEAYNNSNSLSIRDQLLKKMKVII